MRNFLTPFSFSVECKLLQTLMIAMFFLVLIATFASYGFYYYEYIQLAKYFLANMFRFRTSYILMTLMYGVRPFLKGAIHALLFEHWVVQLWLLLAVELAIQLTVLGFEFKYDNHRSKPIFFMDTIYYWSLIALNGLLLMKHHYYKADENVVNLAEELITTIVYLMVGLLMMKIAWEYSPIRWLIDKLTEYETEDDDQVGVDC